VEFDIVIDHGHAYTCKKYCLEADHYIMTVRTFEVVFDKFNVGGVCTSV
jgi:hypothetical protein